MFEKQRYADEAVGFDFIAYHGYARRRYYELISGTRTPYICMYQQVTQYFFMYS